MAQTQARYDQFAGWYQQWIGDAPPLIAAHAVLIPAVTGERVLNIACGQGRMSRYLARSGAEVVGIDISAGMLDEALAAGPEDITCIHADVSGHPAWWDGRPFDGCTCELALMDIDDLAGTLSTVAAVLRPGGWFVASIVHPCFPGTESGRSSWPPGQGYEREGWWTSPDHNPDGVRIRVGATHRKLSTVLNALLDAGLEAERFVEPPAPVSDVPAVAVPPPLTCSLPVRNASAGLVPDTSRRLPRCNVWTNVERPCPESAERPVQRVSAAASRDFRCRAGRRQCVLRSGGASITDREAIVRCREPERQVGTRAGARVERDCEAQISRILGSGAGLCFPAGCRHERLATCPARPRPGGDLGGSGP